jgi:glycosyltransferase involved in cell wall biosynthesis
MRIAIVHYHLQTGGVTRIIEHAISALTERGISVVVLCGEAPRTTSTAPVRVVEGLGYAGPGAAPSPTLLAQELEHAASMALGGRPDIWHVHNHSLGKNLALPVALLQLAAAGHHLLFQIHDFPEDGRPDNYRKLLRELGGNDPVRLSAILYPDAPQVHYAVLNRRDRAALQVSGLSPERLHSLPNPVWLPPGDDTAAPPLETEARLWLYPTRAIRRKNLGEMVLWAAIAPDGERFATTRGPLNPAERPFHERWKDVIARLRLPVTLEIANQYPGSFSSLLGSAHALVSTSVAEGFGMAFLEPWLVGRPVVGRDLPEITGEFTEAGLDLSGLYTEMPVPLSWLGKDRLATAARRGLQRVMGAYGRVPEDEQTDRVMQAWVSGDLIDFGRLDEPMQAEIIERAMRSATAREELPAWDRLEQAVATTGCVEKNRYAVLKNYNLDQYASRLVDLYQLIASYGVEKPSHLNGETILDSFLAPERLCLLRS